MSTINPAAEAAREASRRVDGKFGAHQRAAPEADAPLTTRTAMRRMLDGETVDVAALAPDMPELERATINHGDTKDYVALRVVQTRPLGDWAQARGDEWLRTHRE